MSLIKNVKNPISLARIVMEKTKHNYIVGESAEKLAIEGKLERMDNSYFSTDKRIEQLLKAQESDSIVNDHDLEVKKKSSYSEENKLNLNSKIGKNKISDSNVFDKVLNLLEIENTDFKNTFERIQRKNQEEKEEESEEGSEEGSTDDEGSENNENNNVDVKSIKKIDKIFEKGMDSDKEKKDLDLVDSMFPGSTGTVGCVCMLHGHVAAATSTGGLTNKMAGRIGKNSSFYFILFSFLNIVIIIFLFQNSYFICKYLCSSL